MASRTTSEHGGFVRGLASAELVASKPPDVSVVRDGVVNNLNHLSDSGGQHLINFQAITVGFDLTAPSTSVFRPVNSLPWFPLKLRLAPDWSTYRAVVYLRCGISAAGTASFRLALWPPFWRAGVPPEPSTSTWAVDTSTTSTTGEDKGPFQLYFPADYVRSFFERGAAMGRGPWPSDRADGTDEAVPVMEATFQVWAKTSVVTSLPRVYGLTVREHTGKA